ncbi:hypothetical protein OAE09_00855 [Alphaproteobacteria bacterium]|nr:hypothetical protein [Alphaproteobacteria bacterium]
MKNTLSEKFICSCRQISNKKYEDYTINNQSSSFDQINQTLGVAITCGACLLNAELLYLKLSEKNNITINNWTNHKYKELFNQISKKYFFSHYNNYFKKKIIVQTAPIFSGKNITTDLVISNITPKGFEKETVPFKIKCRIIDANGKILLSKKYYLEKNKRLIVPLNIQKKENNKLIYADGSIWLKMIPLSGGFLGLTRPHIRLSAKNSISSIHLQHARKKGTILETSFLNKNETQYLSVVNLENNIVNLVVKISNEIKVLQEVKIIIQPLESKLINVTQIYKMIKKNNDKYNKIIIIHTGTLRRNIIIYNHDPEIISIDHV